MSNTQSKMIEPINPTVAQHSSIDDQWANLTSEQRRILNRLFAVITNRYEYESAEVSERVEEVDAMCNYIGGIDHYLNQIAQYEEANITSEQRRIADKQFAECTDRYEYQRNHNDDIDKAFEAMGEYMSDIDQYLKEIGN